MVSGLRSAAGRGRLPGPALKCLGDVCRPSAGSVWAGAPPGCGYREAGTDRGLLLHHLPDMKCVHTVGQGP